MLSQAQIGPITSTGDGVQVALRAGRLGDQIFSELQGRFYEGVFRGNTFSIGSSVTALSANTITLTATTTPILGVYNPTGSGKNVVVLQAALTAYINTLTTPVGAGAFVWATSINNPTVSTGLAPMSRNTLQATGAVAKGFAGATALTGLTNALVILESADFSSPTGLTYGTIVAPTAGTSLGSVGGVQNFDGSIIIPPGGVLALLNTTSTVTMSALGRLLWAEVPV